MGAKAMEQPPARRQTKAAVEARSLKGPLKYSMSKAFTREDDAPEDDFEGEEENPIPPGSKNYLTPAGWQRMREEVKWLVNVERPDVTRVVSWAASLGDRSENADYQYGKKRLREIDRRIRYLTKRLEAAEVVDPATREDTDQVFFGATVTYVNSAGEEQTVRIVGIDEMDPSRHYVSWISPVARALIKAREGETVRLQLPSGEDQLEIVEVRYEAIPISPFEAPKRAWNPNA
jgi:transcription elongation factor GreB